MAFGFTLYANYSNNHFSNVNSTIREASTCLVTQTVEYNRKEATDARCYCATLGNIEFQGYGKKCTNGTTTCNATKCNGAECCTEGGVQ